MSTKLEKLLAVFAQFADATRNSVDAGVQDLHRVAVGVPQFVADARLRVPKPTNSQIAAGLEQGLREMISLDGVGTQVRPLIRCALQQALLAAYPEFMALDVQRLAKIVQRGQINTEAEFYLVRHRIDIVEGEPEHEEELGKLYALVGDFEARV